MKTTLLVFTACALIVGGKKIDAALRRSMEKSQSDFPRKVGARGNIYDLGERKKKVNKLAEWLEKGKSDLFAKHMEEVKKKAGEAAQEKEASGRSIAREQLEQKKSKFLGSDRATTQTGQEEDDVKAGKMKKEEDIIEELLEAQKTKYERLNSLYEDEEDTDDDAGYNILDHFVVDPESKIAATRRGPEEEGEGKKGGAKSAKPAKGEEGEGKKASHRFEKRKLKIFDNN